MKKDHGRVLLWVYPVCSVFCLNTFTPLTKIDLASFLHNRRQRAAEKYLAGIRPLVHEQINNGCIGNKFTPQLSVGLLNIILKYHINSRALEQLHINKFARLFPVVQQVDTLKVFTYFNNALILVGRTSVQENEAGASLS